MDGLFYTLASRDDDNGASRGKRALVVTAVLTALSATIVAMRLYARIGLMKRTGWDDWAILISLVFSLVYCALVAAQSHYGMGVHSALLSDHVLQQQLKCLWAAIPMYNASMACTKFSILLQYLRIFPVQPFRIVCYVMIAIVATYSTWAIVSGYVNCVPVAKFWNHDLPGSCLSFEAVWFFNASMNIATDVALLIMPMPLLSRLQLPRMQKLALMGVFAIGILVVITNCNVGAAYWTAAECNVAIICSCLPFLRQIISRIFPNLLSIRSYNHYTSNRQAGSSTVATQTRTRHTQMFSQNGDEELDVYSVNVRHGDRSSHSSFSGIQVTTETIVVQGTSKLETTSERRLVMDA